MTSHFTNSIEQTLAKSPIKTNKTSKNWTLWDLGAGIGLLGGTLLMFGAIFLTIVEFVYGEKSHGIWLFLAVLPLWVVGAHCLDKSEEIEKAARMEYCRQHGVTGEECRENLKENFHEKNS